MAIIGIGCDVLYMPRIANIYSRHGNSFTDKILTRCEQQLLIDRNYDVNSIAKFFSAKEAVFKSISSCVSVLKFKDIEISHNDNGAPIVELLNDTHLKISKLYTDYCVKISISDDKDYVVSYAMCETQRSSC